MIFSYFRYYLTPSSPVHWKSGRNIQSIHIEALGIILFKFKNLVGILFTSYGKPLFKLVQMLLKFIYEHYLIYC